MQIMPGPFGGVQAPPSLFGNMVNQNTSVGPDKLDQNRSANGMVFDDKAGSEKVYLQAQRDLNIAVKNNLTCSVGNNRVATVIGNDSLAVTGFQKIEVKQDRTVHVSGNQNHHVEKNIFCQGDANNVTITKKNLMSVTQDGGQGYYAKTEIVHSVDAGTSDGEPVSVTLTPDNIKISVKGSARIFMDHTAILIDAPNVYINPGATVMNQVFDGSKSAEQAVAEQGMKLAAEAAAAKAKADEKAGQEYMERMDAMLRNLQ
jgi:hypothetical protein